MQHAAAIYNQTAVSKVNVLGPDGAPPLLTLKIQSLGYGFEETSEGTVYVSELDDERCRAFARLEPQADAAGRIVCWRERKLDRLQAATLRTAEGLSEAYLLCLVRRRLTGRRGAEPALEQG